MELSEFHIPRIRTDATSEQDFQVNPKLKFPGPQKHKRHKRARERPVALTEARTLHPELPGRFGRLQSFQSESRGALHLNSPWKPWTASQTFLNKTHKSSPWKPPTAAHARFSDSLGFPERLQKEKRKKTRRIETERKNMTGHRSRWCVLSVVVGVYIKNNSLLPN